MIEQTLPAIGGRRKARTTYRPHDILAAGTFVSFCARQGIQTSKAELRYFEQACFLPPVLRIEREIIEYRRILVKSTQWLHNYDVKPEKDFWSKREGWQFIPRHSLVRRGLEWSYKQRHRGKPPVSYSKFEKVDPVTYYGFSHYFPHGELFFNAKDLDTGSNKLITGLVRYQDWPQFFQKKRMVASPGKPKFIQAATETVGQGSFKFVKDPAELGNPFETFYPPQYVYIVHYLQQQLGQIVGTKLYNFFDVDRARPDIIKSLNQKLTDEAKKDIQSHISDFQKFLAFYLDILNFLEQTNDEMIKVGHKAHRESFDDWTKRIKADQDASRQIAFNKADEAIKKHYTAIRSDLAIRAEEILEQHNITPQAIKTWQKLLINYDASQLAKKNTKFTKPFLDNQQECLLMAYNLNQLLRLCGYQTTPIQKLFMNAVEKINANCSKRNRDKL